MKRNTYLFAQLTLVTVLVAGMFGIRPARAESLEFGWAQNLGGGVGFDVYTDESGNVYTSGSIYTGGIFISKLDTNGNNAWFRSLVGSGSTRGFAITVDQGGSVFAAGSFLNTLDFDPGPAVYNLTSSGAADIFIVKLDTNGGFVWAKTIGGTNADVAYKTAVDQSGNLYVTGSYYGTVDFDPGAGINNLTSAAGIDSIFVLKLDTDGNFVWVKSMGGAGGGLGMSIALDGIGNIYFTGLFTGTLDFDPGIGIHNLVSAGPYDGFISKFDHDGNFVWAQNISALGGALGFDIALDESGYVLATGFTDPVASESVFIMKLNTNGDFIWVKNLVGSSFSYGIAVDENGQVFTTGSFNGTVDFDPGPAVVNLTSIEGSSELFISKLDSNGNFLSAKKLGGESSGEAIAIDSAGNLFLTGSFGGTVDFDPGPGIYNLTSTGITDAFVAKFVSAPQIYYVKSGATGANDGSSWEDAFTNLQSALTAASSGDEIWVAAGTYKPTTGTDRTVSFNLKNGVALYGGFSGTETLLSQRDYETNVTILSGDIGVANNNSDNSHHIVVGNTITSSAVLDGFTITAGNANSPNVAEYGGGIHNTNSSPTLRNLIIDKNSAGIAAGVFNFNSNPTFANVIFSNNMGHPGGRGGALVNDANSSPTLTNVTFFNNSADLLGAGMINSYDSNPYLVNVTFVENSVFNSTTARGGAIYNWQSNPMLINVTISGNFAKQGGAIYNDSNSHTTIINSILYGNIGGEISDYSGTSTVSYSIVQGGYIGTGNLDADPLLGSLQDNGGFTQIMALGAGSPAIDAADDVNCPDTDQRGVLRPQGAHCDMGAYEYVFSPTPTDTPTATATSTATVTPTSTATPTRTPTLQPVAKPGIPVLVSPANGAFVNGLQPILDWKDSNPLAHHYQIQVATNNTFSALVLNENDVPDSTFTPDSELLPGRLYYWRVRAFNVNGVASAWSGVRNFKTPLAQPALVSPANTDSLLTDRPVFEWNSVDGAGQYILQVSAQSNFSTLLVNAAVNGTEYSMFKDLPGNKMLYWRVRAKTSFVTGPWSAKWTFTTGNPPSVPALSSPTNGVLVKNYTPRFNWNNSTVPSGTTFKHYELQVDNDKDFTSPEIETTTTVSEFRPLSELASNTKSYWRVRAVNTANTVNHFSSWSTVWSFRTVILPPQSLSMIPGTSNVQRPSFEWEAATGTGAITGYTIQVSTSVKFNTLLVNQTVKDPTHVMVRNLPYDRMIYWRVRVNGVNGPSAWAVEQFSVTTGLP